MIDESIVDLGAISAILCADWGKESRKRSVYLANVSERAIKRVPSRMGWSVDAVLHEAQRRRRDGGVLVTFDAPLGVPESYLNATAREPALGAPQSFLDFLKAACSLNGFFDATSSPDQWRIARPFFKVPSGEDGLRSYIRAAGQNSVDLYRSIEKQTRGKTVFAKSGIPGSVGSAACALWIDLAPQLTADRSFRLWPFEGSLRTMLASGAIVVGEIYPRAAYATALLEGSKEERPALTLAKTDLDVRRLALDALLRKTWVVEHQVTIADSAEALDNEDDFDACITAAALLRCVLERLPLAPIALHAHSAEGGMLGTGSINLGLAERTWVHASRRQSVGRLLRTAETGSRRPTVQQNPAIDVCRTFKCPIPECEKTFVSSRGGWDGHVGSLRLHPKWHPELVREEDRRLQFRLEFPLFFE